MAADWWARDPGAVEPGRPRDSVAWLHHELRLSAADARSRVRVARGAQLLAGPLAGAQRRADALVDVAALALRSEQLPELSGTDATVDVIVPLTVRTDEADHTASPDASARHGTAVCRPGHEVHPAVAAGVVHDAPLGQRIESHPRAAP